MAKDPRDSIKTNGDMANKRYGSTTGASKGKKPPPKPKITPRIRRKSAGVRVEVKF